MGSKYLYKDPYFYRLSLDFWLLRGLTSYRKYAILARFPSFFYPLVYSFKITILNGYNNKNTIYCALYE